MANQRKRIWIDVFQTRLIGRLLFYCLVYQASLWVILYALQTYWEGMETMAGQPLSAHLGLPAIGAVLALLGLMTLDLVRFVHRLVGPIYRFRKTIQTIVAGEPVDKVQLRQGDFLKDMMKDFNDMLELLEQKGAIVVKDRQLAQEAVAAR